jgi:hypothetical protein
MERARILNGLYKDQIGEVVKIDSNKKPYVIELQGTTERQRKVHRDTPYRKLKNGFKQINNWNTMVRLKKEDIEIIKEE